MLKKRKEKLRLLYYLWPPWLGMLSHPGRLSRLGSSCWTGVGSTQPGMVPFSEPFLRTYCLLCSGWDQSPQRDQELEDLGGNKHLASMSPGASVPNSSLPERAASWAPQHPQQAAVVLDGTVWTEGCEALGGRSTEPPAVSHSPLQFTSQEGNFL